jgi:tetratricopeptide (TPR) repeat protein
MTKYRQFVAAGCGVAALSVAFVYIWTRPETPRNPQSPAVPVAAHATPQNTEHEIASLKHSLDQNPGHVPVLLQLAQKSRETGKVQDAVKYLKDVLTQEGDNHDARLELGRALFEIGDIEGAIRETEELLRRSPSNVDGLYNMGAIYGNLGQTERAQMFWQKAVAADPNSQSGKRASEGLKILATDLKPSS